MRYAINRSFALGFFLLLPFSAAAGQVFVTMSNFQFTPKTVTINVGDTVTWVDQFGSHDIQSDTPLFQSPPPPVQQFSFTFTSPGTVPYHCNPHRSLGMTGTVIVQGAAQNVPPTVSITSPANGATFTGAQTLTVVASASDPDGSIAQVEFFDGRLSLGVVTSAPYQVMQTFAVGTHVLSARATDNQGASTSSSPVTITINATASDIPPTATLTQPQDGALLVAPANLTLEASASDPDGSVMRVDFYRIQNTGGPSITRTLLGSATAAPFRLVLNGVTNGFYHFQAEAIDNSGSKGDSATIKVTVYTPFRIESILRLAKGDVTLLFSGDFSLGQATVQGSADLRSWVDLPASGFSKDTSGRTLFVDRDAALMGRRFYHLRFQFQEPAAVIQ